METFVKMSIDTFRPIIIVGVPRSGTTLLRVMLDSHSRIAAAPETPWILGGYGDNSIRHLVDYLNSGDYGPLKNLPGVTEADIYMATRLFIQSIFSGYLQHKDKTSLVLKTPDDIKHITYLLSLFPHSKFVHITRDGRDVATSLVENASRLFSNVIEGYGELNHDNAIRRWYDWESMIITAFSESHVDHFELRYETLVTATSQVLKDLCDWLGVEFEEAMVNYNEFSHEYPAWEAGTHDLMKRKPHGVDRNSIGRWRAILTPEEKERIWHTYGNFLNQLGYPNA